MSDPQPIQFYDRYSRAVQTEQIYGEKWLRWAYENPLGRLSVETLLKRAVFSHWYGWRMNRPASARKVLPFIVDYGLDVDEFAKQPLAFKTFNDFFHRTLKPGARPIAGDDRVAVLPADGRHLVFPNVDECAGFYVKGAKFTLAEFLGDAALGAEFAGGSLVISRLCPVDYHRFHFPVNGTPGEPRLLNGHLYSVSPVALRRNVGYLVQNKRMRTLVDSPEFGRVAVLEIGATCVGSIGEEFVVGRAVKRGDPKGWFAFGGSCVATVFRKGRVRFDEDFVAQSANQVETYARMGDRLGVAA